MFDIKSGDSVIVLCDREKGMAIVKPDVIEDLTDNILDGGKNGCNKNK